MPYNDKTFRLTKAIVIEKNHATYQRAIEYMHAYTTCTYIQVPILLASCDAGNIFNINKCDYLNHKLQTFFKISLLVLTDTDIKKMLIYVGTDTDPIISESLIHTYTTGYVFICIYIRIN